MDKFATFKGRFIEKFDEVKKNLDEKMKEMDQEAAVV